MKKRFDQKEKINGFFVGRTATCLFFVFVMNHFEMNNKKYFKMKQSFLKFMKKKTYMGFLRFSERFFFFWSHRYEQTTQKHNTDEQEKNLFLVVAKKFEQQRRVQIDCGENIAERSTNATQKRMNVQAGLLVCRAAHVD